LDNILTVLDPDPYSNTGPDPGEPFQYGSTWIRIRNTDRKTKNPAGRGVRHSCLNNKGFKSVTTRAKNAVLWILIRNFLPNRIRIRIPDDLTSQIQIRYDLGSRIQIWSTNFHASKNKNAVKKTTVSTE